MQQSWIALAKTLYAGGLRFATTLTMLAFAIFGTRLLGPETFGSYISIMAIATIATTALGLGLPALLGREVAAVRGGAPDVLLGPVGQWLLIINVLVALCALGCGSAISALPVRGVWLGPIPRWTAFQTCF